MKKFRFEFDTEIIGCICPLLRLDENVPGGYCFETMEKCVGMGNVNCPLVEVKECTE